MDRKDKIKLINQLEIGAIPIEMFQPPRVTFKNLETSYFRRSRKVSHDEDYLDVVKTHSGINPYTGKFYGEIIIYIVK
jgi:hypothetical protein